MWTLPYSAPQKAGVILYGILIGVLMIPLTALACCVLGLCLAAIGAIFGLGGEGGWVLIGSFLYGLYLGVPVGLVVCWKVCRSRLRDPKPTESC